MVYDSYFFSYEIVIPSLEGDEEVEVSVRHQSILLRAIFPFRRKSVEILKCVKSHQQKRGILAYSI